MTETVFLVLLPLGLAFIGFFVRGRFGLQLGLGLAFLVLCLLPGLRDTSPQPGSTWQGYAVTILLPFLLAVAGMALTNRFSGSKVARLMAFGGIPLLYWLGLLLGISVAVTAGWASP